MEQLSEYEQLALNKLGQSIHDGKWSNTGLVQLKKQNKAVLLFNQKYIIDNQ